jgi:FXSXX-COOH protein
VETGRPHDGHPPEWRSAMIDVSESSLPELVAREDSALDHCLRRLADDLAGPSEQIAGFNSAL